MKSERRKAERYNWGTARVAARGLNVEAECYGLTHTYCHNEQGQWPITITFFFFFQILNFMHAQSTYFHQGYDLMNDLDVYMRKVSKQVSEETQ